MSLSAAGCCPRTISEMISWQAISAGMRRSIWRTIQGPDILWIIFPTDANAAMSPASQRCYSTLIMGRSSWEPTDAAIAARR